MSFDLLAVPDPAGMYGRLEGAGQRGLLVAYAATPTDSEAARTYLETILTAVGCAPVDRVVRLLWVQPEEQWELPALCRQAHTPQVVLFGIDSRRVGVHAHLPPYELVRVGGLQLMWADELLVIKAEREAGDKTKASALWQAFKTYFPAEKTEP